MDKKRLGRVPNIENPVNFTLVIPGKQKEKLRSISQKKRMTVSALIREAIEKFIKMYKIP